jgi:hypothetical protein
LPLFVALIVVMQNLIVLLFVRPKPKS